MTSRRAGTDPASEATMAEPAQPEPARSDGRSAAPRTPSTSGIAQRRAASPRTAEEAEARYVSARNAWAAAMRAASSGRPADLASLAIAQEAYEAASAERARWQSGARVAIAVEPEHERGAIDVVVGQELAWRKVHQQEEPRGGLLGKLFGRRRER